MSTIRDYGRHHHIRTVGHMTKNRNSAKPPALPPRTETMQGGVNPVNELSRLFVQTIDRQDGHQAESEPQSFVFLHGLGGTHGYWTAADGESHLPPGSILVDLLGFGRSPRPFTRYTLDSHLAALEPVLESRAPSVLVGHSLGAALALAYAARHPSRVTALVLISLPSYGGPRGAFRWFRRRLRGWFLTNMALTALVCVVTRRLLGPILPMLIRDVPPEVARDLVEHNFMSSTTSLWDVLYRGDVAHDFDALPEDLAVVFVHGTNDVTAPIDSIRGLVKGRSNSRLVELIGVDHHPWLRRPAECVALITSAGRVGRGHSSAGGPDGWRINRASLDVFGGSRGLSAPGSVNRGCSEADCGWFSQPDVYNRTGMVEIGNERSRHD